MELIISGAVVLLVSSFAAWKLLRRSQPGKTQSATPASPVAARPSTARQHAPAAARPQTTAKAPVVEMPVAAPVPAHVEALDLPRTNKAAAAAKTPQAQKAAVPAAATPHGAKDEAEDWLIPSLSAKGNDDADTELVLEDD